MGRLEHRAGQLVFAAILVALGVWSLVRGDFSPVLEGVSAGTPARDALVVSSALISIGCGVGLAWRPAERHAARVLAGLLAVWVVAFRAPVIARAPGELGSWFDCAETLVVVAAALALARYPRAGRAVYGLCLIPFGLGHFLYATDTAHLVPGWIPVHFPIVYATGAAFLAAGAAILVGVLAPLAAALSAAQIGGFTLLVWVPIAAAGATSHFVWHELGISAALTAGAWVIADSCRAAAPAR